MSKSFSSFSPTTQILLVGCGRMGSALLRGWCADKPVGEAPTVTVIDPTPPPAFPSVKGFSDPADLPASYCPLLVVFAIKPQQIASVLPHYQRFVDTGALFVSIAAGITIEALCLGLGDRAQVVRAMPNTPAAIGQGMSVLCARHDLPLSKRELATAALVGAGAVRWIEDETQMDAVTALSGSGPAYLFYLTEILADAGERLGLAADIAADLARQTMIGSAALMAHNLEDSPAALRQAVTSPQGTTEAALNVLQQNNALGDLFATALLAAQQRSQTLRRSLLRLVMIILMTGTIITLK